MHPNQAWKPHATWERAVRCRGLAARDSHARMRLPIAGPFTDMRMPGPLPPSVGPLRTWIPDRHMGLCTRG